MLALLFQLLLAQISSVLLLQSLAHTTHHLCLSLLFAVLSVVGLSVLELTVLMLVLMQF
jgi:hypothetical protein